MSAKETQRLLPDRRHDGDGDGLRVQSSFLEFLKKFWQVCISAFGGPSAHVAMLHDKFVDSTSGPHLPESTFVELFALASALPGPGSTQLATALGATFGGLLGALICFLVWFLPGALIMTLAGIWFHTHLQSPESKATVDSLAVHCIGLISAAFSMVVIAALKITQRTCYGSDIKMLICIATAVIAVLIPPASTSWVFVLCLACSGAIVLAAHKLSSRTSTGGPSPSDHALSPAGTQHEWQSGISPTTGAALLALFALLTIAATIWNPIDLSGKMLQTFWRIGWTVFGGGQVVIPMILSEVVESGWLPSTVFLSGFGIVGCLPGPMFNIAPFLGASMLSWRGAFLATLALYGPGIILILGLLPFWENVRKWETVRHFMSGVNASAAGLIIAGVWMLLHRTLVGPLAFAIAVSAAAAHVIFEIQTPLIIVASGIVGSVFVAGKIGGPYHLP